MIFRRNLPGVTRECLVLGCAILAAAVPAQAQSSQAPPPSIMRRGAIRDVPTEGEVRKTADSSIKFEKALGSKARPLGEARPNMDSNLLDHSLLLFDGEKFTIIPEGSLLRLPPPLLQYVIEKPAGDFMLWPAFLKRNSSWLAAKEVPLKMSRGDAELAKGVLREVANDPHVVVAVYHGGPIMVLEAEPDDASQANASTKVNNSKTSSQRKQP